MRKVVKGALYLIMIAALAVAIYLLAMSVEMAVDRSEESSEADAWRVTEALQPVQEMTRASAARADAARDAMRATVMRLSTGASVSLSSVTLRNATLRDGTLAHILMYEYALSDGGVVSVITAEPASAAELFDISDLTISTDATRTLFDIPAVYAASQTGRALIIRTADASYMLRAPALRDDGFEALCALLHLE